MRWRGERESSNVEDQRGMSGGGRIAIGGGLGTLVIIIIAVLLGADPRQLLQQVPTETQPSTSQSSRPANPKEEELKQFVSVVLGKTEDVWQEIFRQNGKEYREPKLVLFSDQVQSACGMASAASGPFYCPGDQKVYIDLAFYEELRRRFSSPGDFAQAYVIAHEVGHHVQKLLGISDRVDAMQQRMSEVEANKLSVRLELQADFFAGVFARYVQKQGLLEEGDIEEALHAASAIGDDAIQRQTSGRVVPDSFTHGTSEQRLRWFRKGFDTGDIRQGDTFAATNL
ncbi:MAG TPA: neutral zinc metallopeptidase [Pyrinomonadaceae bacterium]|jgi:Predicted metalloprotease|nr:neutral zinc metallopeptidase [Pyrinomonadaceae bacterium]